MTQLFLAALLLLHEMSDAVFDDADAMLSLLLNDGLSLTGSTSSSTHGNRFTGYKFRSIFDNDLTVRMFQVQSMFWVHANGRVLNKEHLHTGTLR